MTKRKVTDLLPTEAILISSDAERDAVLKLFQEAGMKWNEGEDAMQYIPATTYDYGLGYKNEGTVGITVRLKKNGHYQDVKILPATDFIQIESDEVEVSDTVLLSEVRNKLNPIKNLIAMLENGLVKGSVEMHDLVLKEIEQCKINIEELTRNPETK